MKRLWMTVVITASALGLAAQEPGRTLRPQQAAGQVAVGEARTALVIGNASYPSAPLKNPVQDAKAMAEALRRCGFQVTLLENAARTRMVQALRDFGQTIQGGGVGLLYYAGHGMQVKGKNYLVPVDADLASEDEVPYNTLDADAVLAKMESARNRLNILILDACRNNPFARSFRSSAQGLAQMDAPAGSYIAFATSPGRTAADGAGSHGLYTQHLLDQLARPGIKVEDVFKRVRTGVMRDSQQQQVPWESSSITGDFYFVAGVGSATDSAPSVSSAVELAYWDSIKGSSNAADFQAYLSRYPGGHFADLARNRVAALGGSAIRPGLDPILQQCLQARGGLEVLQGVRGLKIRGSSIDADGAAAFTRELSYPRSFLEEIQVAEGIAQFGSDGLRGWMMGTSLDRSKILQPPTLFGAEELRLMASTMELTDPMVLGAEGIGRVESSAASTWEGRPVQTLRIVLSDEREYLYWIDPATHLPLGYRSKLPGAESSALDTDFRLTDYRRVGDILYPFRTDRFDAATKTWLPKEALEEVIVNPVFPPDHFKAPADLRAPQAASTDPQPSQDPQPTAEDTFKQIQQKAERGDLDAMADLGLRLEAGDGVKADLVAASRWYRQAAQKGHARAQCYLAVMLASGRGVRKDQVEAVQWYRKSAAQDWAEAQFNLGWACQYGEGVPKDQVKAAQWYRKASDAGHVKAMVNLGWMYEFGQGVPKDPTQAVVWYQKAAEGGEATAQCNLGWMYESGLGIAMDLKQAALWYRKSAEQGQARGQKCLGVLLRDGMGVAKDLPEAARWFKSAAEQGEGDAQVALGLLHSNGLGMPVDDAQAMSWFLKAANAGHAAGQSCVGWAYEVGRGIEMDLAKAVRWYRKAAMQGQPEAKEALARLGQK